MKGFRHKAPRHKVSPPRGAGPTAHKTSIARPTNVFRKPRRKKGF